jgi:hypothetical protein
MFSLTSIVFIILILVAGTNNVLSDFYYLKVSVRPPK